MTPASIQSGHLIKRCETCGQDAYFSTGTNLRRAMDSAALGQTDKEKRELGKWFCQEHWKGMK